MQSAQEVPTLAPQMEALVASLRTTFRSGRTKPLRWRLAQLDNIGRFVKDKQDDILRALEQDLGKPRLEAWAAEVQYCLNEVDYVRKRLRGWMKPARVRTPLVTQPGSSRIHSQPLGVVLIIGAWNYPVQLVIAPLIGAIAAGNCAVIKPSEVASATSALIARWLPEYLDGDAVQVVEGGVPETTALLEQRFDHIFYTGNGTVGRIIMTAAAKHLTPVTLELGGKSPCIVDREVDLDIAAKRIAWGKFYNAGQTCVAPDYVLVHRDIHEAFVRKLAQTIHAFYGDDPQASPDFARIINERHHRRVMRLMASGTPAVGGDADESDRYIAPTVLTDVSPDSPIMKEEIFGPLLPVLPIDSINEAVDFVLDREKPLALYVFSRNPDAQRKVLDQTSSGAATVNHVWLHMAVPELPFGGVGESGMGAYHGRTSFDCFSHQRGVLRKPMAVDPPILYPPYTADKAKWVRRLL